MGYAIQGQQQIKKGGVNSVKKICFEIFRYFVYSPCLLILCISCSCFFRSYWNLYRCSSSRDSGGDHHRSNSINLGYKESRKACKQIIISFFFFFLLLYGIAYSDCGVPGGLVECPAGSHKGKKQCFYWAGYIWDIWQTWGWIYCNGTCGEHHIYDEGTGDLPPDNLSLWSHRYLRYPAGSPGNCQCGGNGCQWWNRIDAQVVGFGEPPPPDSDGDGYDDEHDPFPNDPNCPGDPTKVWESTSKLDCNGCYIREWRDTTGECGNIIDTNCPDSVLNDPSAQCSIELFLIPTSKIYSELADTGANMKPIDPDSPFASGGFSVVHMGGNSPDVEDKPTAIKGSGGSSGTASPDQVQDADTKVLADYLSGIQQNQAGVAGQLQDTNSYLQGLIQQHLKNGQSLNDLISWLKQGEGSQLQPKTQDDYDSNIDLSQFGEAGQEKDISGLLDSFISNSPILSAITGSHIEITDQVCSFGGQIFGKEITFNFCDGSVVDLLNLMGQFFVAICSIAFFFIAFA